MAASTPTTTAWDPHRDPVHAAGLGAVSIIFGKNVTPADTGSAQGLYLIVSKVHPGRPQRAARSRRRDQRSVPRCRRRAAHGRALPVWTAPGRGPDAEHRSYRSFASFRDPDGWLFQEITARLPGRIDPATSTFASANDGERASVRPPTGGAEARTGRANPELAGLVRRVHGARAGRRRAAEMNNPK